MATSDRQGTLAPQIALHSHDVVRFLKPRPELIVEVDLSPNGDEMSPPPRSVICGLDDPRAVQPATWTSPRVEKRDVLSSKIKYGGL